MRRKTGTGKGKTTCQECLHIKTSNGRTCPECGKEFPRVTGDRDQIKYVYLTEEVIQNGRLRQPTDQSFSIWDSEEPTLRVMYRRGDKRGANPAFYGPSGRYHRVTRMTIDEARKRAHMEASQ